MIYLNWSLQQKKWLLLFLSLLFCWWLLVASGTCSASEMPEPQQEQTYTITETQLKGLETRLTLLDQILTQQNPELTTLQLQLAESKKELAMLRNELSMSREQLTKAEESLQSANQLLEQYAAAAKKERLRIKAQRNTWLAVALVAATVAIIR